ncbi:uncharacterized protein LOC117965865 isoform X1 [Acipenser ruthenus]|uniref:uncharacterized protein LOC117965865 isoform X1 n=1 Tax=Acipenser ruthenus TaxID=7906 RepID=UPI002741970D|nr:uncharacterized protein LOC117965865 isoform X1 [Acipenser ruthenus]
MEKKSADVETVTGASGILSVSQSFGSFGRDYKGIIPARDARSMSWNKPNLSNPKIPGLLRRVFKGSDRKSRHQEVGEWSLEECRHSIMELAKEMNRVVKNSAIPTPVSSEDTCSLEECRCFIMKWAGDLDKLVQTPKQSQSAGQVEQRKGAELRNKEDLPGPEGEELSEGAGKKQGEELDQEEEQRLKDGHDIIMQWARELKTVPENSVSAGEAVEQGLAELVKEWKQGKLSNILPIMEFIMWALIKKKTYKGMLKSQNIGAGRCIPDSVWQWIHKASVDSLTLDLDTAHPRLTLPVDEKHVKSKRQDHNNPQRFDYRRCVLGKEGFSSGRHYWELGVGENTFWRLGVSRESAPKKGKFSMTPQQGYWTVGWSGDEDKDEFTALTDPQTPLPPSLKPQKLGVYLDYEEGQLSFYNVETRSHIYTFTDMEFNPNEKLYPFFWSLEYKDLALVSPGKMNDSFFFLLVWKWILAASVDSLTLDLDTAHPRLTLPVDEKQVKSKRQDHNNPQRFDYRRCVLGKEGFTSGRHYWELGVGENTFWRLGVSRESAPKKGKFSMTPQQGYWTVGWSGDEDKDEFTALTDPQTPLPPSLKPQKLGVYLDYEEGQLSFYNVETRSHIYTFTDMEFNPNEKLYPFFWSLEYKDLALVSPGKMNDSSFLLLVWEGILAASVDSLTLDLDTAHPRLTLPVDEKQVKSKRQDHNNPQRFDYRRCVLGKEGFTSGRHYWELGVGENTFWRLGVSRESAPKKGKFSMTPQQGYWTVGWSGDEDKDEFTALTDPQTPLPPSLKPQKLGVYLDYEEGQLSFYNVETRSHIYTFTDMEFNPNEKLYPFFWSLEYKDLALVSPGKMNDSSFLLLVWEGILAASVDSLTLDLDTAHPRLTLPVDEKQVRRKRQDHNNPQRFDYRRCVLGKEGFTSGRHYWELGVGENTFWRLGVSRESAPKKGKFSMTPQQGYWTVGWSGDEDKDEFTALTDPQTPLPPSLKPQKLRVYLDYEEGQLSFYNVETRSHIYTFTDMEFNPNEKLYPFFWSLEYKDLALVSPGKMNDSSFLLLVWEEIHAASVDVTLDPDTAQSTLILSAEGKQVRWGVTWQSLPDNPERFDVWPCVLGRESFTSERHYWQVQVGGNTRWILGVSRESAKRKRGINMTPQKGYWTVGWYGYRDAFTALTDPQTPLPQSLKPQKLGVYLDYEEGQLSFYNVETRSHIYTFTDMEFNPNEKLYPFFYTYCVTALVLESPDPDPVSAAD